MLHQPSPIFIDETDRLRMLFRLRGWVIIVQLILVALSQIFFHALFAYEWLYFLVFMGFCTNILNYILIRSKRVQEWHSYAFLFFDLIQWTAILSATGGLHNPFASFLILPFIIGSVYTDGRKLLVLGAVVIASLTFLSLPSLSIKASVWTSFFAQPIYIGMIELSGRQLNVIQHWLIFISFSLVTFLGYYLVRKHTQKFWWAHNASAEAFQQFQQSSAIGTVATAAIHELGTPLNTIQLITEDMRENKATQEDIDLLLQQTERCKEILQEMSYINHNGGEIQHLNALGLLMTIEKIALTYKNDSIGFHAYIAHSDTSDMQMIWTVDVSYVLRNIIQNAYQFAKSDIEVQISWERDMLIICVDDDGPGFSDDIIKKIGTPYISGRSPNLQKNHMGLGLFVAKSLMEQTGGELHILNNAQGGARVILSWSTGDMYKRT